MSQDKVRYVELLPHEFRRRLAQRPVAYLPLGTLEWHGEHLPLGSDAIQSEAFMVACAERFGGIVMPAIHLGPDRSRLEADGRQLIGMDTAATTTPERQLDGSCYWVSEGLFLAMLDAILAQLKRAGFKAVLADGHGPSRQWWSRMMAAHETRHGLKLMGWTQEQRDRWTYQVDHAAKNETSIMMHVCPGLVDLSQLPEDRAVWPQGVNGQDPRDATAAFGKERMEETLGYVGEMLGKAGV